jgi:hypothetical protein
MLDGVARVGTGGEKVQQMKGKRNKGVGDWDR